MDFIPIEPGENLDALLESFGTLPLSLVSINNAGDYENENILLKAEEDIDSLYDYMLFFEVEDMNTGYPDYAKSRYLTFSSDIELQKGSTLRIYTRTGEDSSTIGFETGTLHHIVYWGLPAAILSTPHSTIEIHRRGNSSFGFSVGPSDL